MMGKEEACGTDSAESTTGARQEPQVPSKIESDTDKDNNPLVTTDVGSLPGNRNETSSDLQVPEDTSEEAGPSLTMINTEAILTVQGLKDSLEKIETAISKGSHFEIPPDLENPSPLSPSSIKNASEMIGSHSSPVFDSDVDITSMASSHDNLLTSNSDVNKMFDIMHSSLVNDFDNTLTDHVNSSPINPLPTSDEDSLLNTSTEEVSRKNDFETFASSKVSLDAGTNSTLTLDSSVEPLADSIVEKAPSKDCDQRTNLSELESKDGSKELDNANCQSEPNQISNMEDPKNESETPFFQLNVESTSKSGFSLMPADLAVEDEVRSDEPKVTVISPGSVSLFNDFTDDSSSMIDIRECAPPVSQSDLKVATVSSEKSLGHETNIFGHLSDSSGLVQSEVIPPLNDLSKPSAITEDDVETLLKIEAIKKHDSNDESQPIPLENASIIIHPEDDITYNASGDELLHNESSSSNTKTQFTDKVSSKVDNDIEKAQCFNILDDDGGRSRESNLDGKSQDSSKADEASVNPQVTSIDQCEVTETFADLVSSDDKTACDKNDKHEADKVADIGKECDVKSVEVALEPISEERLNDEIEISNIPKNSDVLRSLGSQVSDQTNTIERETTTIGKISSNENDDICYLTEETNLSQPAASLDVDVPSTLESVEEQSSNAIKVTGVNSIHGRENIDESSTGDFVVSMREDLDQDMDFEPEKLLTPVVELSEVSPPTFYSSNVKMENFLDIGSIKVEEMNLDEIKAMNNAKKYDSISIGFGETSIPLSSLFEKKQSRLRGNSIKKIAEKLVTEGKARPSASKSAGGNDHAGLLAAALSGRKIPKITSAVEILRVDSPKAVRKKPDLTPSVSLIPSEMAHLEPKQLSQILPPVVSLSESLKGKIPKRDSTLLPAVPTLSNVRVEPRNNAPNQPFFSQTGLLSAPPTNYVPTPHQFLPPNVALPPNTVVTFPHPYTPAPAQGNFPQDCLIPSLNHMSNPASLKIPHSLPPLAPTIPRFQCQSPPFRYVEVFYRTKTGSIKKKHVQVPYSEFANATPPGFPESNSLRSQFEMESTSQGAPKSPNLEHFNLSNVDMMYAHSARYIPNSLSNIPPNQTGLFMRQTDKTVKQTSEPIPKQMGVPENILSILLQENCKTDNKTDPTKTENVRDGEARDCRSLSTATSSLLKLSQSSANSSEEIVFNSNDLKVILVQPDSELHSSKKTSLIPLCESSDKNCDASSHSHQREDGANKVVDSENPKHNNQTNEDFTELIAPAKSPDIVLLPKSVAEQTKPAKTNTGKALQILKVSQNPENSSQEQPPSVSLSSAALQGGYSLQTEISESSAGGNNSKLTSDSLVHDKSSSLNPATTKGGRRGMVARKVPGRKKHDHLAERSIRHVKKRGGGRHLSDRRNTPAVLEPDRLSSAGDNVGKKIFVSNVGRGCGGEVSVCDVQREEFPLKVHLIAVPDNDLERENAIHRLRRLGTNVSFDQQTKLTKDSSNDAVLVTPLEDTDQHLPAIKLLEDMAKSAELPVSSPVLTALGHTTARPKRKCQQYGLEPNKPPEVVIQNPATSVNGNSVADNRSKDVDNCTNINETNEQDSQTKLPISDKVNKFTPSSGESATEPLVSLVQTSKDIEVNKVIPESQCEIVPQANEESTGAQNTSSIDLPGNPLSSEEQTKEVDDVKAADDKPSVNVKNNSVFLIKPQLYSKSVDNQRVWTCDICSFSCRKFQMFRKHYLRLHVSPKYISESDKGLWDIAEDEPNNEKLFKCHVCKGRFDMKSDLKNHLGEHSEKEMAPENVYNCPYCQAVFNFRKAFVNHKKGCVNNKNKDEPITPTHHCLYCNETFYTAYKKKIHILSIHPYTRKKQPCFICNKIFQSNSTLFSHLVTSHQSMVFGCLTCKERYLNSNQLREHYKKVHPNENVKLKSYPTPEKEFFDCSKCKRVFLNESCLNKHTCSGPIVEKEKIIKQKRPKPLLMESRRIVEETDFFSKVTNNVQENLTYHLDGKLHPVDPPCEVPSSHRTILNFNAGVQPSVVPSQAQDNTVVRSHSSHIYEKFTFPKEYDGRCGLTSFIKDASYLDISTQLIMRRNLQRLNLLEDSPPESQGDVPSVLALERLGAQCAESFGTTDSTNEEETEDGEGSRPSSSNDISGELSGEWVRERTYVCSTCLWQSPCLWSMEDHKYTAHPHVWTPQHELNMPNHSSIANFAYRRLVDWNGVQKEEVRERVYPSRREKYDCTKCGQSNIRTKGDLHRHIVECAGEDLVAMEALHNAAVVRLPTGKKKPKWRGGGRKTRQGLKRNIPTTPPIHQAKKNKKLLRTKPGDADTIEKMIANLPAKRATRRVLGFDEVDIKTRSQATIQNNPSSMSLQATMKKSLKPVDRVSPVKKMDKKIQGIDTSAENGNVLSSLRMMPVKKLDMDVGGEVSPPKLEPELAPPKVGNPVNEIPILTPATTLSLSSSNAQTVIPVQTHILPHSTTTIVLLVPPFVGPPPLVPFARENDLNSDKSPLTTQETTPSNPPHQNKTKPPKDSGKNTAVKDKNQNSPPNKLNKKTPAQKPSKSKNPNPSSTKKKPLNKVKKEGMKKTVVNKLKSKKTVTKQLKKLATKKLSQKGKKLNASTKKEVKKKSDTKSKGQKAKGKKPPKSQEGKIKTIKKNSESTNKGGANVSSVKTMNKSKKYNKKSDTTLNTSKTKEEVVNIDTKSQHDVRTADDASASVATDVINEVEESESVQLADSTTEVSPKPSGRRASSKKSEVVQANESGTVKGKSAKTIGEVNADDSLKEYSVPDDKINQVNLVKHHDKAQEVSSKPAESNKTRKRKLDNSEEAVLKDDRNTPEKCSKLELEKQREQARLEKLAEKKRLVEIRQKKKEELRKLREDKKKVKEEAKKLAEEKKQSDEEKKKKDIEELTKKEEEDKLLAKAEEDRKLKEKELKRIEEEKKAKEEEITRRKEEEKFRKEEEKKRREEEKKRKEEETAKKKEEEKKRREEEKRRKEEEKRRKEEEAKLLREEEEKRKLEHEEKLRIIKEEEERRRQEEERKREEEAAKLKEEEKRKREEEAAKKKEEEKRKREEEAARKKEEEKRRKEEEAKKREEEKRKKEEDAAREKEEEKRKQEEEKRKKEEEEKRKKEEEKRKQVEEAAKRKEEERRKKDEEAARKREEDKRRKEEEKRKKEEEKRKREEDAAKKREEERKKREELAIKRKEEAAKKKEEAAKKKEEEKQKKEECAAVKKKEDDDKKKIKDDKRNEEGNAEGGVQKDLSSFEDAVFKEDFKHFKGDSDTSSVGELSPRLVDSSEDNKLSDTDSLKSLKMKGSKKHRSQRKEVLSKLNRLSLAQKMRRNKLLKKLKESSTSSDKEVVSSGMKWSVEVSTESSSPLPPMEEWLPEMGSNTQSAVQVVPLSDVVNDGISSTSGVLLNSSNSTVQHSSVTSSSSVAGCQDTIWRDSGYQSSSPNLGSILDSVNTLLNEPDVTMYSTPLVQQALGSPQYSLADLQRAMGASDAEMAVLQQLGEMRNEESREEDWNEVNIIDLDKHQNSAGTSSVKAPGLDHPAQSKFGGVHSVVPHVKDSSGGVTWDPAVRQGPSLHPPNISYSPSPQNVLGRVGMDKRPNCCSSGSVDPSSALLAAHPGKEVVCPTCSCHFIGFPALQLHISKYHRSREEDYYMNDLVTNKRAMLESAKGCRLVCFVCQQILPSNLMASHLVVEHHTKPIEMTKCQVISDLSNNETGGEKGGENLKNKMTTALGDLLDRAVNNLLTVKQETNNRMSGSAMQLLNKLSALKKREESQKAQGSSEKNLLLKAYAKNKLQAALKKGLNKTMKPSNHTCGICGETFLWEAMWKKHVLDVHTKPCCLPKVDESTSDLEDDESGDESGSAKTSTKSLGSHSSTVVPSCSDRNLGMSELPSQHGEAHKKTNRPDSSSLASSSRTTSNPSSRCSTPVSGQSLSKPSPSLSPAVITSNRTQVVTSKESAANLPPPSISPAPSDAPPTIVPEVPRARRTRSSASYFNPPTPPPPVLIPEGEVRADLREAETVEKDKPKEEEKPVLRRGRSNPKPNLVPESVIGKVTSRRSSSRLDSTDVSTGGTTQKKSSKVDAKPTNPTTKKNKVEVESSQSISTAPKRTIFKDTKSPSNSLPSPVASPSKTSTTSPTQTAWIIKPPQTPQRKRRRKCSSLSPTDLKKKKRVLSSNEEEDVRKKAEVALKELNSTYKHKQSHSISNTSVRWRSAMMFSPRPKAEPPKPPKEVQSPSSSPATTVYDFVDDQQL